jgi:hypothetical protein
VVLRSKIAITRTKIVVLRSKIAITRTRILVSRGKTRTVSSETPNLSVFKRIRGGVTVCWQVHRRVADRSATQSLSLGRKE